MKNNSILAKKITFIIYRYQQQGNITLRQWFLPSQKVKFDLPVKSKIFITTDSQVNRVMQGKRIVSAEPFLRVDEKINDTIMRLHRRE